MWRAARDTSCPFLQSGIGGFRLTDAPASLLEGVYGNDNEGEEAQQTIRAVCFLAKI